MVIFLYSGWIQRDRYDQPLLYNPSRRIGKNLACIERYGFTNKVLHVGVLFWMHIEFLQLIFNFNFSGDKSTHWTTYWLNEVTDEDKLNRVSWTSWLNILSGARLRLVVGLGHPPSSAISPWFMFQRVDFTVSAMYRYKQYKSDYLFP